MPKFRSKPTLAALIALAALAGAQAAEAQARDGDNPTCPPSPNWSSHSEMHFTVQRRPGQPPVLLAEGAIDDALIPRLQTALESFEGREIRLRSAGGNARIGNLAGRIIRQHGLQTRIPAGWACAGACNFLFFGGTERVVDPDGLFIVQMFTHTGDRQAIRDAVAQGEEDTIDLIDEIAQQSRQVATGDYDFLIRMGVSPRLLSDIMYRQSAVPQGANRSTRRCLTREELREYRVVSG